MKIAVTGASGQLGRTSARLWSQDHDIVPLTHADLDISVQQDVMDVICDIRPDVLVNTVACNDVDGSESDTETARLANVIGPANLAVACQETGALLVHYSTDYVFDGTATKPYVETDITNPLSVYGKSKLDGEKAVWNNTDMAIVIRAGWLCGIGGPNFIETMLKIGPKMGELNVVSDQWGTPTFCGDVARHTEKLITSSQTGLFHMTSQGECTWHQFSEAIFTEAGHDVTVLPATTEEIGRPAPRPRYAVLENAELKRTVGDSMPQWKESLKQYLAGRE